MEDLEQRDAGHDEHRPQHQRHDDAERQHVGALGLRDGERAEQDGDHEHVVQRQRLLHQEAGPVRTGGRAVGGGEHDEPEGHAGGQPQEGPGGRALHRARAAMGEEQVDREHEQDRGDQRDPAEQGDGHLGSSER